MAVSLPNVDEVRDNLKKIQKNLECPICLELLSDPYTTHCSHPFCRTCIYTVILSNKHAKCPLCKEPISKRSMNENTRLGGIVEAVKDLEQAIIRDSGVTKTPPRVLASHSREASGTPGVILHSLLHPTPQKHLPTILSSSVTPTDDESPGTSALNRRQSTGSAVIPSSPAPPPCPPSTSSSSGPVVRRKRRVRFSTTKPSTRRSTRLKEMTSSTMTNEHRAALLDAIENAQFDHGDEERGVANDKQSQEKSQDVSSSANSPSGGTGTKTDVFEEPVATGAGASSESNSVSNVSPGSTRSRTEHVDDRHAGSCITPQRNHTQQQSSANELHSSGHDVETDVPLTNTTTVLETPFVGVAAMQHGVDEDHRRNEGAEILAEETQLLMTSSISHHHSLTQTTQVQQVAETQFNSSPDTPTALSSPADDGNDETKQHGLSTEECVVKSYGSHVISSNNTATTQTVVVDETQLTRMTSPISFKDPQSQLLSSLPASNSTTGNNGTPCLNVSHQKLSIESPISDCSPVIPLQNVPTTQSLLDGSALKSPSGSLTHSPTHSCTTGMHDIIIPSSQPSPAHKHTCLPHLRSQFDKKPHPLSSSLATPTQTSTIHSSLVVSQDITSQELEVLRIQAVEKEREIRELEAAILAARQKETNNNESAVTNFEPCLSSVDVEKGCDTLTSKLSPSLSEQPDECVCVPSSLDDCTTTVIAETAPENGTPQSNTQFESHSPLVHNDQSTPSLRNTDNNSIYSSERPRITDNDATIADDVENTSRDTSSTILTTPASNKRKKKRLSSNSSSSRSRRRRSRRVIDSQCNDSNSIEETKILSVKTTTHQSNTSTIHPLIEEADSLLRKLRAPPSVVLEERSKIEIDDALYDINESSSLLVGKKSTSVYRTRSQSKRRSNMSTLTITHTSGTPVKPDIPGVEPSLSNKKRKASSSVTPTDNRKRQKMSPSVKKPSTPQSGTSQPSSTNQGGVETTPTTSCVARVRATIVETPAIRLSGLRETNTAAIASSDGKKLPLSFVGSGLTRIELRQAQLLAKKHGGRIASCFNGSTSHVIVTVDENGLCPRTVKYLQALAAGKWVVQYQWIDDSLVAGQLLPEEHYEVRGDRVVSVSNAPKLARQKRSRGEPGLFVDCTFLLLGNYGNLTPEHLCQLIQLGDGNVLSSLDDARQCSNDTCIIIVCDDGLTQSMSTTTITAPWVSVSSTTILDSLSKYSWELPQPCHQ